MDNMNPFDIIVLVILVLSAFWGGMRGVVSQIATIASWGLSWFFTARYYTVVGRIFSNSESQTLSAVVLTFALCVILLTLIFNFLKRAISLAGLGEFDRQMGALFGIFKGALFCMLIAFFAVLASDKSREIVNSSKTGPVIIALVNRVEVYFPDSTLKDQFRELVESNKLKTVETKTIESDIDDLKSYLVNRVLKDAAAAVIEEADAVEETGKKDNSSASDFFQSFVSNIKKVSENIKDSAQAALDEDTERSNTPQRYAATTRPATTSSAVADYNDDYIYDDENYDSYARDDRAPTAYMANDSSGNGWADVMNAVGGMTSSAYPSNNSERDSYSNSTYASNNNYAQNYDSAVYDNPYLNNGMNHTPSYVGPSSYDGAYASNSSDLSNNGGEFGFRGSNASSTRTSSARRRTATRTASSARLGSYSYSSNY